MPVFASRADDRRPAAATGTRRRPGRNLPQIESLEDRGLAAAGVFTGAVGPIAGPPHVHPAGSMVWLSQHVHRSVSGSPGSRSLMNVVYLNEGGRQEQLDLYLPGGPAPAGGRPVILAIPGGGWRWVRRSDLGSAVAPLTKYGYAVAVADYTFSSGAPGSKVWPTNFQDVRQAVLWLGANAGRFGIDPNRVAVWGESAGGHLASLLGTDPQGPGGAPGDTSARVEAVIDFYGPADLTRLYTGSLRARPYLVTFLGGTPDQVLGLYSNASPVSHVTSAAPPFLIFQGTTDLAVPADQSAGLAAALGAAGVPHHIEFIPGVGHGFRLNFGANGSLLPQVLSFLDAALNHGGQGVA